MFLYDKPPHARTLTNSGVTLRKKTQAFTGLNDQVTQFVRGGRIMNGNQPHDPFKVRQKGVLEDYLEVHSFNRARTCRPECPWPSVTSAWASASSSAAKKPGWPSSHSLTPSAPASFATKVLHDFRARRRSSSGLK